MRLPVERWIERWNAYWFPETTTLYLSITRIVMVATQLFWFFPKLERHLNLLEKNSEFINPQLLISGIAALVSRETLFTPSTFTVLYWTTAVAGVAALVGLFTRLSLFVFSLGTWIFVAHAYSYGDRHHPEAVFAIILLALSFAPAGESLSLDALIRRRALPFIDRVKASVKVDTAMWPLKLAHVLLALTYFSTGMSKLILGGPAWLNGYTLQNYTLGDAVSRDIPLGIWIGQQHRLAIGLSFFTILIETFFFVSLVLPWTAPFIFVGALLFQIGLLVTAGHGFYQHMVLLVLLLFFIRPQWWQAWRNKYVEHSRPSLTASLIRSE
jgi:hypothetical protein